MNGRTAKLLRRWSLEMGAPVRPAKDLWNKTPRNKRGQLRQNILSQLAVSTEPELVQTEDGKTLALAKE